MTRTIAITGCTGFIGQHLVSTLLQRDVQLRLLLRRHWCAVEGDRRVERIAGSLEDRDALAHLMEGADVAVHLAGAIWAPSLPSFMRANRDGTRNVMEAAVAANVRRTLLVSSLAARDPEVSAYAASKRAAENVAREVVNDGSLTILRPPAVYGPGDRATLPVFRQLNKGFLLTPKGERSRFSLIYVEDLIDLMARLIDENDTNLEIIEPDDGVNGGYSWRQFGQMAAMGLQQRIRRISIPKLALSGSAKMCDGLSRLLGKSVGIGSDKLKELFHDDWVARGDRPLGWQPIVCLDSGVARTMNWYSANSWL